METDEVVKSTKNIGEILEKYNLIFKNEKFIDFSIIPNIELSSVFIEDLEFSLSRVGTDDKESFMSEFVIVPFLKDTWKRHKMLNLFSHVQIKADDLTVIPDYLITGVSKRGFKQMEKPLLVTVEAKFEQFLEGWKQAILQMIVAQKINLTNLFPVYCIVTTGKLWEFGKLENNIVYQHATSVGIENPNRIAGILSHIFELCEKNTDIHV